MPTLLQRMTADRAARNEAARQSLRLRLKTELTALLPAGETVWVYGSLVTPGRFNEYSDVDVALGRRPERFSEYWLQGELELRLRRRVDVVLLPDTRLRRKIETEGEAWTL